MTKSDKITEANSDKKAQQKQETFVQDKEQFETSSLANGLPKDLIYNSNLERQVDILSNPDIPVVQRQKIADQIGRMQGNLHLQRVISQTKGDEKTPPKVVTQKEGHSKNGLISRSESTTSHLPTISRIQTSGGTKAFVQLEYDDTRHWVNQVISRYSGTSSETNTEPVITTGTTDQLISARDRLIEIRHRLRSEIGGPTMNVPSSRERGIAERNRRRINIINQLISVLERRIANRGNSTLADSDIKLRFNGQSLSVRGAVNASFSAVSGVPSREGEFDYSPRRQQMANEGPIPEGTYWLDVSELQNKWYYPSNLRESWGTRRIPIHPFDTTHTFGRGGFFIHGGSQPGSIGCIDLTNQMGDLAEIIAQRSNQKIILHVVYPSEPGDFPVPDQGSQALS